VNLPLADIEVEVVLAIMLRGYIDRLSGRDASRFAPVRLASHYNQQQGNDCEKITGPSRHTLMVMHHLVF
jgi:hypothetical protein